MVNSNVQQNGRSASSLLSKVNYHRRYRMKNETSNAGGMIPATRPLWRRILGLPSTRLGWWSLWLLVGFLVFIALFQILVASGERGGETFFSNLRLSLMILLAAASAIAGGVAAAVAIFSRHERSILSILALLLGLFVTVFVLGEIIVPH